MCKPKGSALGADPFFVDAYCLLCKKSLDNGLDFNFFLSRVQIICNNLEVL